MFGGTSARGFRARLAEIVVFITIEFRIELRLRFMMLNQTQPEYVRPGTLMPERFFVPPLAQLELIDACEWSMIRTALTYQRCCVYAFYAV